MSRSTSLTFREAAFAQQTDEAFIILITLDHADLTTPIRVTSDAVDTVVGSTTYTSMRFELEFPGDEAGIGKITIDNVSRTIIEAIRSISSPPTLDIQVVLGSDPTDVILDLSGGFKLRRVDYDVMSVSGDITIEDFSKEAYPGYVFTPNLFKALF